MVWDVYNDVMGEYVDEVNMYSSHANVNYDNVGVKML